MQTAEVCFFYHSPKKIVGLSMAICYDCGMAAEDYRVAAIVETLGAEFVNVDLGDTTEADGDPCEIVIGILIDSSPPFDDRRFPATRIIIDNNDDGLIQPGAGELVIEDSPQELVCVKFRVKEETCDEGESMIVVISADACAVTDIVPVGALVEQEVSCRAGELLQGLRAMGGKWHHTHCWVLFAVAR